MAACSRWGDAPRRVDAGVIPRTQAHTYVCTSSRTHTHARTSPSLRASTSSQGLDALSNKTHSRHPSRAPAQRASPALLACPPAAEPHTSTTTFPSHRSPRSDRLRPSPARRNSGWPGPHFLWSRPRLGLAQPPTFDSDSFRPVRARRRGLLAGHRPARRPAAPGGPRPSSSRPTAPTSRPTAVVAAEVVPGRASGPSQYSGRSGPAPAHPAAPDAQPTDSDRRSRRP